MSPNDVNPKDLNPRDEAPNHYPHRVGEWPDLSNAADYRRQVDLARRRLIGYGHHAEDAVSRAVLRWLRIPADRSDVARLEQLVKSEAATIRRSDDRAHGRERRRAGDRALTHRVSSEWRELETRLLRQALLDTAQRIGLVITDVDEAVLDLVFDGFRLAEAGRELGLTRYEVRRAQERWRVVVRHQREVAGESDDF